MSQKSRYIAALMIFAAFAGIFIAYKWGGGDIVRRGEAVDLSDLPAEVAGNVEKKSGSANIFRHPELGFSFEYPNDYGITRLSDDEGETVLLQKNGGGAQIYISDYESEAALNAALVRSELSGEKVENVKDVDARGGFGAVSFGSSDPSLGDTLEFWFVRGRKLYQMTAQKSHSELLEVLSSSWRFE